MLSIAIEQVTTVPNILDTVIPCINVEKPNARSIVDNIIGGLGESGFLIPTLPAVFAKVVVSRPDSISNGFNGIYNK